jgi:arylsulfatase A-like enzyme
VICLIVDRLHAGMVGPYGNAWIRTPELDRLASESFLFDQAVIDNPRLESLYRSYWQGGAAIWADDPGVARPTLAQIFDRSRIHTALLTDERVAAEHPLAADFAERIFLEPDDAQCAAEDIAETQMAHFFATAQEWLAGARQPFCLWLHSRGMAGPWDAPLELRNEYAEDEDPTPPEFVQVPLRTLPAKYDPDELLGITQAYAGQVSLLDMCLGALLSDFRQSPLAKNTLLVLLSARGFPLGEHLRVGPCDEALYNETVQLVWMMRFPDGLGAMARSPALVQPADLPRTLLDWYAIGAPAQMALGHSLLPIVREELESVRDRACIIAGDTEMALRTPAWHLRQSGPPRGLKVELFAKPTDRWEVNEVANRLPEIVAKLQEALNQLRQTGQFSELPPLSEDLVVPVD